MDENLKGGHGRLLVRLLDQLNQPLAVLDRRGQIVYVNTPLCRLVQIDATQLVGRNCSWQIAADDPLSILLTALAPPGGALEGRAVVRQLTAPILYGSAADGQVFLPLQDDSGVVHATLVILGQFERIRQIASLDSTGGGKRQAEAVLVQLRGRWKSLEGLTALIGTSPAVRLAMTRSQLAVGSSCNLLIHGPAGVGKLEVAQGIFLNRGRSASLSLGAGQCFPVDCRVLDAELFDSMLEIFQHRLSPETPRVGQQLILVGLDQLTMAALDRLTAWLDRYQPQCVVLATSGEPAAALAARGGGWSRLVAQLAIIEIALPPLALRREDIAPLAYQALADACAQADRAQLTLTAEAVDLLEAYAWPGNIRQLRKEIFDATRQAVLTPAVQANHLAAAIRTFAGAATVRSAAVEPIRLDQVFGSGTGDFAPTAPNCRRTSSPSGPPAGNQPPTFAARIEQLGLGGGSPNPAETRSKCPGYTRPGWPLGGRVPEVRSDEEIHHS